MAVYAGIEYTPVNPKPQGTMYGRPQYDTLLWGQDALEDRSTTVHAHFSIMGPFTRVIHSKYKIKARYSGTESTIEDVYSYGTVRYMMLGCLDGPMFRHKTKSDVV